MKHKIEIEGLPEGWRAVAFRNVVPGEFYFSDISNQICISCAFVGYALIVEKIKPRRIVLEETKELRIPFQGEYYRQGLVDSPVEYCSHSGFIDFAVKIWRIVSIDE